MTLGDQWPDPLPMTSPAIFRQHPQAFRLIQRQTLSKALLTTYPQRWNRHQTTMNLDIAPNTTPMTESKLHITTHETYDAPEDLRVSTVLPSPLDQFRVWFESVQKGSVREPEAVALSTANAQGVPSVRFVLLKELDNRGFVFFTNYTSRKSEEIIQTGHAALAFYWREVHKQVRVVGKVEKITHEETAAYFRSRPVGSRLGAWASKQSSVVKDGEVQERLDKVKTKFGITGDDKELDVPVPDFWGGWRIVPDEVEFWAGKPSRLHDRVRYLRDPSTSIEEAKWTIDRLSP